MLPHLKERDFSERQVKIKRIEKKFYPVTIQWVCGEEKILTENQQCQAIVCRLVFSDYEMIFLFDVFLRHFSKIYDEALLQVLEEAVNPKND